MPPKLNKNMSFANSLLLLLLKYFLLKGKPTKKSQIGSFMNIYSLPSFQYRTPSCPIKPLPQL